MKPCFLARASFLALLAATAAHATPVFSTCTPNPSGGTFTCDIYETDASGNPSEISDIITPGNALSVGDVVLLESPTADPNDVTTWSDVVIFTSTTVQLLSDGCNCFPSLATVLGGPNQFIIENQVGVGDDILDFTTYGGPSGNTYRFHSAAPVNEAETPEPGSAALLGLGLAGLIGLAIKRRHSLSR